MKATERPVAPFAQGGTSAPAGHQPRIGFVLGKPVQGNPVLAAVLDHLRELAATVTVHVSAGDAPMPAWLFESELVVQRGLGGPELASARHLEHAGVRCCNRIGATIAVQDRALTDQTLADAGVPVPATVAAATWAEVIELTGGRPVVVKAADARIGRGLGVLIAETGTLPSPAPFAGPYLAQSFVPNDERDYKVYVAGRHARGLVKGRPPRPAGDQYGVPFFPDGELTDLARMAGRALGLEIYGVDFVYGPDGPVVVDVNPFPGFRGVPRAARLVARHLAAIATGRDDV